MGQIVAIRFLHFNPFKNRFRAFQWMGRKWINPWEGEGLVFSKHLGVGAGKGFSIFPDFSQYVFLGVFDSQALADQFFLENKDWNDWLSLADSWKGIDGKAIKGHGLWNGKNPFILQEDSDLEGKLAVITRASIAWTKAIFFWANVPKSSRGLSENEDLLLAKGVGEAPLIEQATISIWKNQSALENFAYRSKNHQPMIKKTRELRWYKEEMFIRLRVLKEYFI